MRGTHTSVESWLLPDAPALPDIYLDAAYYRQFVDWLQGDTARFAKVATQEWCVWVFKRQLRSMFGGDSARDKDLQDAGFQFPQTHWSTDDDLYVREILYAYFQGNLDFLPRAEFLVLARRHARAREGVDRPIHILTQHRAFLRIPMVNTYSLPGDQEGFDDLPAQFDFFTDLRIHKDVRKAALQFIGTNDYPHAVFEGAKGLFDYLRFCSGLMTDGANLVEQALQQDGSVIRLNTLASETERNEQRGYQHLSQGVVYAVRHPTAHVAATDPYIVDRFGDKRTALKVLCLLSLICERLDKRAT